LLQPAHYRCGEPERGGAGAPILGWGELMRGEDGGELDRGPEAVGCELPRGELVPLAMGGAVCETGAVGTRCVAVPRSCT